MWSENDECAGTGTYREKNMGKCSDGRMVSIPSTNSDPSTHLRKCELLPSVRRSVSRTHMTDALNWARFNELWSLWAAQLIFSFISQVQMKSGNRRPIAAGDCSANAHLPSVVIGTPVPVMAFKDQFHGENQYLCPNLLPTFVEELL